MLGFVAITPWHWAGFILCVLFFLALDLGLFNRHAHVVKFQEAAAWSTLWFVLAMGFAAAILWGRGREEAVQFTTGYLIELSLSMDNVFVIALIFAFFRVPSQYQHRVLFWGILGALLMRGVMIAAGAALVQRFQWTLYLFGAFLIATGIKMLLVRDGGVHPEKNLFVRVARKFFPVTNELQGQKFIARVDGRRVLTPLALVLLVVETSDLIFALDSIPAIFAVTTKPFIVFTSNVFAILGLRSLYFLLAGAIDYFRYLKVGLSVVLVFIGVKMLLDPHGDEPRWIQVEIPTGVSLMVVATIIIIAIVLSVMVAEREKRTGAARRPNPNP
ncbi:MAG TPA: TerC family protein [Candidatus Acidoferrum sp.]|nr:TerC family protein [Candidatus Acidoferrum sp.]